MPDETPEQVTEPIVAETKETETPKVPTIEELTKQIADLAKANETQKTEIAGLNSANSKEVNKYNELVQKHETDKERESREKLEAAKVEQDRLDGLTTREATLIEKENSLLVKEKAVELNFSTDERKAMLNMGINTVEGVIAYRSILDDYGIKLKEETAQNIIKSHSGKPEGYKDKQDQPTKYGDILSRGLDS